MCIFDTLTRWFGCLAKAIPMLVTASSIATAVIPNPSPETAAALVIVHKVLDVMALNVANNTPTQP